MGEIFALTRDRVYYTAVHSVLTYICETWGMKMRSVRRFQVFGHRNLRNIAYKSCVRRIRNIGVGYIVLRKHEKSVNEFINLHRLWDGWDMCCLCSTTAYVVARYWLELTKQNKTLVYEVFDCLSQVGRCTLLG